jgi:hypothetical protein
MQANFKRIALTLIIGLALLGLLWPVMKPAKAAGEDGTRDAITVTNLAVTGTTQTLAAASGDGHKFVNNERTFVTITNGYTATITATFVTPATQGGLAIEDVAVALTTGQTRMVGPFPKGLFDQQSGADKGMVYLTWDSAVTGTVANSVTLKVYALP